eukprot:gene32270-39847_t
MLKHKGYVCRIGDVNIPLPLTLILGECSAQETAVDEDTFSMKMSIDHFALGEIYSYDGVFKVTDIHLED